MNLYSQPSTHLNTLLGLLKGLKVQPEINGQSILDSQLQDDIYPIFTRATVAQPEGMRAGSAQGSPVCSVRVAGRQLH